MDWCRLWHDAPDDPKWRVIAQDAGVRVGDAWAVFTRMLVRASASGERGSIEGWNDRVEAAALGYEPQEVAAIREAMQGLILDGDRLSGWAKRQPKRERDDSSTDRVREHRERQKAQETAIPDDETPCNANDGTETPRLDESREDREEIDISPNSRAAGTAPRQQRMAEKQRELDAEFERWWLAYPLRVAKGKARKLYLKARSNVEAETLEAAAKRYANAVAGKDPEFIAHPTTWLNAERWLDEAPPSPAREPPSPVATPRTQTGASDEWLAMMWNEGKRSIPQLHNPITIRRLVDRGLIPPPEDHRRTA